MSNEKIISPKSGYMMLVMAIALIAISIFLFVVFENPIPVIGLLAGFFILPGFIAIEPNSSRVLTLFGKYVGTINESGFFWTNPFYMKKKID